MYVFIALICVKSNKILFLIQNYRNEYNSIGDLSPTIQFIVTANKDLILIYLNQPNHIRYYESNRKQMAPIPWLKKV